MPRSSEGGDKPHPYGGRVLQSLDNPLIAKVLHSAAVGMGFIPVLPTADKIQSKYPAAARVGISPTPTERCNHFDNLLLANV